MTPEDVVGQRNGDFAEFRISEDDLDALIYQHATVWSPDTMIEARVALALLAALQAADRESMAMQEQIGEYFAADELSDQAELAERRALRKVGGHDEPSEEEINRLATERIRAVHRWKMARERLLLASSAERKRTP